MSTLKTTKSDGSYSVKYSNKTGGAYADMKDVIRSERDNWTQKSDKNSYTSGGDKKSYNSNKK
jgi:hypothetical protein